MAEATSHAETYHRHGDPDPSNWQEAEAVTGRPNDIPLDEDVEWAVPNSTLAERAAARKKAGTKKVDEAENKAVTTASTKTTRKRK